MLRTILALALAGLAAPGLATPAWAVGPPDPRGCPRPAVPDAGERERTKPLPVPPLLRSVMGSSLYHYAVSTLGGARICVDVSWVNTAEHHTLSPDRRFVTFGWLGYESYGHKLIDRSGAGQVVEVGAMPVFSPSRRLFAAVDQTESEFGSLSGLAIWRVRAAGVAEVARIEDLRRMYGWRIDGWAREDCIDLSAVPFGRMKGGDEDVAKLRRDRFVARPRAGTWRVVPAAGANRCPAR